MTATSSYTLQVVKFDKCFILNVNKMVERFHYVIAIDSLLATGGVSEKCTKYSEQIDANSNPVSLSSTHLNEQINSLSSL